MQPLGPLFDFLFFFLFSLFLNVCVSFSFDLWLVQFFFLSIYLVQKFSFQLCSSPIGWWYWEFGYEQKKNNIVHSKVWKHERVQVHIKNIDIIYRVYRESCVLFVISVSMIAYESILYCMKKSDRNENHIDFLQTQCSWIKT